MKIIITTLLLLIAFKGFNQEEKKAFESKTSTISFGYGFGNYVGLHYLKESRKDKALDFHSNGIFFVKYEYAINQTTGVGVNFSFASVETSKQKYNAFNQNFYNDRFDFYDTWSINLRFNKHFKISKKSNFYFGAGIGYRNHSDASIYYPDTANVSNYEIQNSYYDDKVSSFIKNSPINVEATIGIRCKLTKRIGFYTEIGLAKGFIQSGLTFNTVNTQQKVEKRILNKEKKEKYAFSNNAHIFSGGVGLAMYQFSHNDRISSSSPVLNFKYEYGANEEFGFGVNVATYEAAMNYTTYDEYTKEYQDDYYTTSSFLFRINYHPVVNEKTDFYFGAGIGYRYAQYNEYRNNDVGAIFPIGFELTAGFRYYPIKHIGLFTEVGLAKSLIQAGVVVKF